MSKGYKQKDRDTKAITPVDSVATQRKRGKSQIVRKLPSTDTPTYRDPIPDALNGSTIISIGSFRDHVIENGRALVIDCREAGTGETRRIILAFDDQAMWEVECD
ncbi:MAG TPA: hypothetical protein VMY37_26755 [Thermoguttaceae bacterium]|nr:hypothetical protein [Thermoguttaceae bacterium]